MKEELPLTWLITMLYQCNEQRMRCKNYCKNWNQHERPWKAFLYRHFWLDLWCSGLQVVEYLSVKRCNTCYNTKRPSSLVTSPQILSRVFEKYLIKLTLIRWNSLASRIIVLPEGSSLGTLQKKKQILLIVSTLHCKLLTSCFVDTFSKQSWFYLMLHWKV